MLERARKNGALDARVYPDVVRGALRPDHAREILAQLREQKISLEHALDALLADTPERGVSLDEFRVSALPPGIRVGDFLDSLSEHPFFCHTDWCSSYVALECAGRLLEETDELPSTEALARSKIVYRYEWCRGSGNARACELSDNPFVCEFVRFSAARVGIPLAKVGAIYDVSYWHCTRCAFMVGARAALDGCPRHPGSSCKFECVRARVNGGCVIDITLEDHPDYVRAVDIVTRHWFDRVEMLRELKKVSYGLAEDVMPWLCRIRALDRVRRWFGFCGLRVQICTEEVYPLIRPPYELDVQGGATAIIALDEKIPELGGVSAGDAFYRRLRTTTFTASSPSPRAIPTLELFVA